MRSILAHIAANPSIDPAFKRGIAMLLESAEKGTKPICSQEEHDETIHLSETAFDDRRKMLAEVAAVQAAFTAVRDEYARLCQYWRVDAGALEDMTNMASDLASELQHAVRREYSRE